MGLLRLLHGGSCCAESERPAKRVRPSDKNPAHYAFHYSMKIDGMICSNCVRHVENAFNMIDGIYAKVDRDTGMAKVHSKKIITFGEAAGYLKDTAYTLIDIREEKL